MSRIKRAILVVLDGVGAGANPDAHAYGDDGASSLEHCAQAIGGLELPNLGSIGLGVVYLLFCWTFIPSVIALVEGIIYLTMSDAQFAEKYG